MTFSVSKNIILLLIGLCAGLISPATAFEIRNADARAGFASLSWQDSADGVVELQWRADADTTGGGDWKVLYRGTDNGSTITGLDEGTYQFRLVKSDGTVTAPLNFTVQHHSLALAFQFFGAGAVLFVILIGLLVWRGRESEGAL